MPTGYWSWAPGVEATGVAQASIPCLISSSSAKTGLCLPRSAQAPTGIPSSVPATISAIGRRKLAEIICTTNCGLMGTDRLLRITLRHVRCPAPRSSFLLTIETGGAYGIAACYPCRAIS